MIVFLLLNVTPQSDDFLLVLPITSFTVVGGHIMYLVVCVLTLWGPTENVQQVRCNQKTLHLFFRSYRSYDLHLFRFLLLLCIIIIIIIKCSFIWGMISLLSSVPSYSVCITIFQYTVINVLTFNSAELTGHTIIVVIFLESMQETVQVKIKSSTLVKLFERYHFSKSGHLEVSRYAFKIDHFWHTGKLLKTKNAIEIF